MPSSADVMENLEAGVPGFRRLRPQLERAIERMDGLVTSEQVLELIAKGDAQFWPYGDSCAVTEIVTYPSGQLCRVWLGAGDLDQLRVVEEMIRRWARSQGCLGVEIIGRDGWGRALDGYRKVATVYVHRFDEESSDV